MADGEAPGGLGMTCPFCGVWFDSYVAHVCEVALYTEHPGYSAQLSMPGPPESSPPVTPATPAPMNPFDSNPRKLEPAQNGFRICHDCGQVVDLSGREHLCYSPSTYAELLTKTNERAEYAESLLCALALRHGFERERMGFLCGVEYRCLFCESARESTPTPLPAPHSDVLPEDGETGGKP